MKVLSLFDGMSCGQIALKKLGYPIEKYFASEVDRPAILESKSNFPDMIHIGDVREIDPLDYGDIDLLIGGSPCQSFSFSGKGAGMVSSTNEEVVTLDHYMELKRNGFSFIGQSYLFWEYCRILRAIKEINPNVKFLLENVVMLKKWESVITNAIGVEPIKLNSALVSAQNRERLYWTNIEVDQLEDRNISLSDILETDEYPNKASIIGRRVNANGFREDYNKDIPIVQCLEVRGKMHKSNCITTVQKDNVLTNMPLGRHLDVYGKNLPYRNYTLTELCRLQTVPEDYFKVGSRNQASKMLGNGWTVDIIAHILKNAI